MQRKMLSTVTAAAAALAIGAGVAAAQAPKKGGELNFSVVAEPPNYDCHGSTTFALIHPIAPHYSCLLYTSPSPRDISGSRMPSSA